MFAILKLPNDRDLSPDQAARKREFVMRQFVEGCQRHTLAGVQTAVADFINARVPGQHTSLAPTWPEFVTQVRRVEEGIRQKEHNERVLSQQQSDRIEWNRRSKGKRITEEQRRIIESLGKGPKWPDLATIARAKLPEGSVIRANPFHVTLPSGETLNYDQFIERTGQ